jgi:glyoxylase-like metal-dependent hydrolase (beta-lactamase superfamily II)
VIVERVEHPQWTSNAYLLAEGDGGSGVLVDSNGEQGLLDEVESRRLSITHVLVTHHHPDHIVGVETLAERFGVPLVGHPLTQEVGVPLTETVEDGDKIRAGGLEIQALGIPGHCRDQLAYLVNGTDVLTADCLFKGTIGGTGGGGPTGYEDHKRSIMERLMALPPETRVHPGHTLDTTIGDEWESNPFIRIWRGLDEEGAERCRVRDEEATLVLWASDYDGTNKAWVRYDDGRDAIVGGSQVVRG